jgi:hypothetical protein
VDVLFEWGVFNRVYDLKEKGKNTGAVNKVVFTLTDKPQKMRESYFDEGKSQSSVDMTAKEDEVNINIYFSANGLESANRYITVQALYLPFLLTHTDEKGVGGKEIERKYSDAIDALIKGEPIFAIRKVIK